ncbi:hypothetical protein V5F69_19355 [Xanthobacter sp. V2C-4]
MRRAAPSPAPEPKLTLDDFFPQPDPASADFFFMARRITAFGEPKVEVRWPTIAETHADACDGEIRAIAHQYSVPAAALFAMATESSHRSRDSVEGNAFFLMRRLKKGEALEAILSPAILARISELEG